MYRSTSIWCDLRCRKGASHGALGTPSLGEILGDDRPTCLDLEHLEIDQIAAGTYGIKAYTAAGGLPGCWSLPREDIGIAWLLTLRLEHLV